MGNDGVAIHLSTRYHKEFECCVRPVELIIMAKKKKKIPELIISVCNYKKIFIRLEFTSNTQIAAHSIGSIKIEFFTQMPRVSMSFARNYIFVLVVIAHFVRLTVLNYFTDTTIK